MRQLVNNELITKNQHGFVPGRSCSTQLLETLDDWTSIIDDGGSVDVVYIDFMKAFDTMPHGRLLIKLSAYGFKGQILGWIRDFLRSRKQRVVVNSVKSEEARVGSGIPQGSVLGPSIFVIFINDLPENVRKEIKMFADDTQLYVRSDKDEGPQKLQEDLNAMQAWSNKWLLRFHPQVWEQRNPLVSIVCLPTAQMERQE